MHYSGRPCTCIWWLRDFNQPPNLHQTASESAIYMPLAVANPTSKDVDASMDEDAADDVGEEADEVEYDTDKGIVEEAASHMKMGLKYQMSPVTLKIQSETNYQTKQVKG